MTDVISSSDRAHQKKEGIGLSLSLKPNNKIMEKIASPSEEFLLEKGLEILHKESQAWASDIAFWKDELKFFQKLLEFDAPRAKKLEDKQKLERFQNLIIYYSGELLDEFNKKVRQHEEKLSSFQGSQKSDDTTYLAEHGELSSHLNSFRQEFRMYKKELFDYTDEMMSR